MNAAPASHNTTSQEEKNPMTYVNVQYISVARANEARHHERTMHQLRTKIAQLTKAVTWELEQHDSRIKELQQAENTLPIVASPTPSVSTQPTLAPIPSSLRQWTQTRKFVHRSEQKPVAQLVG
jgi:hypothetical protein